MTIQDKAIDVDGMAGILRMLYITNNNEVWKELTLRHCTVSKRAHGPLVGKDVRKPATRTLEL
jgi:hypothetical protein